MKRATITLRDRRGDGSLVDGAHENKVRLEEYGIWIEEKGRGHEPIAFIPWSSVVRIDYEPCRCDECEAMRTPPKPGLRRVA